MIGRCKKCRKVKPGFCVGRRKGIKFVVGREYPPLPYCLQQKYIVQKGRDGMGVMAAVDLK